MVYEKFYGTDEHFSGWRCILCGEIVDQVILKNRQAGAGRQNRGRRLFVLSPRFE
jgi:hypothetical protein